MSDFNMFHGERVKYAGYHPLFRGCKGVVGGGDHHNIRVEWEGHEDYPPRLHEAWEIVWLVDSGE